MGDAFPVCNGSRRVLRKKAEDLCHGPSLHSVLHAAGQQLGAYRSANQHCCSSSQPTCGAHYHMQPEWHLQKGGGA